MTEPQVTIIVVPRERFSFSQQSLESIYDNTQIPFNLVYVDGGSPSQIRKYLQTQAREKNFELIRTDYYLSPNHARNLGLSKVNSKYVAFLDNDVVVSPGWLKHMVQCAEETGATLVTPLVCQGIPLHEVVHCAGGETYVLQETKNENTRRRLHEKMYKQGKRVEVLREQLQRQQTGLVEFHCMMARTEIFEQIGLLDEALLSTREHIDLSISVAEAGGSLYFEPTSVVTYLYDGLPLELSDLPFYMLRWSDAWGESSLKHFRRKWNLSEDKNVERWYRSWLENSIRSRRKRSIIQPLLHKLTFGRNSKLLEKIMIRLEKKLNPYITTRYTQRQSQFVQNQAQTKQLETSVMTTSSNN